MDLRYKVRRNFVEVTSTKSTTLVIIIVRVHSICMSLHASNLRPGAMALPNLPRCPKHPAPGLLFYCMPIQDKDGCTARFLKRSMLRIYNRYYAAVFTQVSREIFFVL